jgi:hypothetical protein
VLIRVKFYHLARNCPALLTFAQIVWYARGDRDGRVELLPVDEQPRKIFILVAQRLVHAR